MKKFLCILLAVVSLTACTNGLWDKIGELEEQLNSLDGRVSKLEELCKEMNTNISSLQTLVSVLMNDDYITAVVPITKDGEEIGYAITFGKHEPITIYHGQNGADGKDGANGKDGKNGDNGKDGADGKDGSTPIIGVKQDTDGAYYWTLNGEWLLDADGNKLPLTSRDGKQGDKGEDGKDGITPQLKIENNYWYISYDNGATWTQLNKAVGEDGKDGENGKDGKDGKDGETIFQSVTQDENYVYFTLTNGTVLTVPRGDKDDSVKIVDGAIMAAFSVSDSTKVYFSQGNLQYNATLGSHLCADGTTKPGTWRFAENQWETASGDWIDQFAWGSSGYKIAPDSINAIIEDHDIFNTSIANTYYDWGLYNSISSVDAQIGEFRTLTKDEWQYLLNKRTDASNLKFGPININDDMIGYILLPDDWFNTHQNIQIPKQYYTTPQLFNLYAEWNIMEKEGIVLLLSRHTLWTSTSGYLRASGSNSSWYFAYSVELGNSPSYNIVVYSTNAWSYILDGSLVSPSIGTRMYVRLVKDVK